MNTQAKYYRVLNESEEVNVTYNSVENQTSRQQAVQSYYPQIEAICILSLQCDIKLASALRIATQYGQVLDEVQEAVRNGDTTIPLELFLVFNESKTEIHLQHVVDFIVNYNQIYQYTGLYFDEERGQRESEILQITLTSFYNSAEIDKYTYDFISGIYFVEIFTSNYKINTKEELEKELFSSNSNRMFKTKIPYLYKLS